jgi:hypothetical protein
MDKYEEGLQEIIDSISSITDDSNAPHHKFALEVALERYQAYKRDTGQLEERGQLDNTKMLPLELSSTDFMLSLNHVFARAIISSNILDKDTKSQLIKEINDTWIERKEDPKVFIKHAVGNAIAAWHHENFRLSELWRDVAINAANHSSNPQEIADNAIEQFKKTFNLRNKHENN